MAVVKARMDIADGTGRKGRTGEEAIQGKSEEGDITMATEDMKSSTREGMENTTDQEMTRNDTTTGNRTGARSGTLTTTRIEADDLSRESLSQFLERGGSTATSRLDVPSTTRLRRLSRTRGKTSGSRANILSTPGRSAWLKRQRWRLWGMRSARSLKTVG